MKSMAERRSRVRKKKNGEEGIEPSVDCRRTRVRSHWPILLVPLLSSDSRPSRFHIEHKALCQKHSKQGKKR